MTRIALLQGSYHMENPSSPKCFTTAGGDNERQPFRDGIGVDG